MAHDYRQDVGNIHVVDYYLYREVLACAALYRANLELQAYGTCYTLISPSKIEHIPLERIGRYLDGEEEREGLYR